MTPKAQQIGTYDVPALSEHLQYAKKEIKHQRTPSSGSEIIVNINSHSAASLLLGNLSNRVSSVVSPAVIFLIVTPIALRYPLLQLIMFLTILIGTSPLYFIMITFAGKDNKHNNYYKQPQPHRRQPSIVGSIEELSAESKSS